MAAVGGALLRPVGVQMLVVVMAVTGLALPVFAKPPPVRCTDANGGGYVDLVLKSAAVKKGRFELRYEYPSGVLAMYPLIEVPECVITTLLSYGGTAMDEQPKAKRLRVTVVTTFVKENKYGRVVGHTEKRLVSFEITRKTLARTNTQRFLMQLRYPPTWKTAMRKVKRLLSYKYCNSKLLRRMCR